MFQLDYICKPGNEPEAYETAHGLNETYDRIWIRITGRFSSNTDIEWD